MPSTRRALLQASAALALTRLDVARPALAQSRGETLRYVTGANVNTLDCSVLGTTREAFGLTMHLYDRLLRFGRKQVDGAWAFDPASISGELAESYAVSPDGLKITLRLRPGATFHDGSKVTAEDVKWSLDRAVSAKSIAQIQFPLGSMTSPSQFAIVDDATIAITLPEPDRLALANLCVPVAEIFNSRLVKPHCTPDDPWGLEWTRLNPAGSGAYTLESYKPGESVILRRNEAWSGGKLPYFRRIIVQTVPDPATRASLVEKGDADLCIDLAATDIPAVAASPKAKIVSTPQTNGFTLIAMNTQVPPFDNLKIRQAIAAALPYEDMFQASLFGRGRRLFGDAWTTPPDGVFPRPMPFRQDLPRARQLLAEAGMPNGFKTSFAFSAGAASVNEPVAALVKEALARLAIEVDVQKKPDAEFNTVEASHQMPFFIDAASAWLPSTDYFFRLYFTRDQRFNFSNWRNPEMERLSAAARFERDDARYTQEGKDMIALYERETPMITLWQPNHEAAMAKDIEGYTYQYYRQADFRDLTRT